MLACTKQHQFCTSNGCLKQMGFDQVEVDVSSTLSLTPKQNSRAGTAEERKKERRETTDWDHSMDEVEGPKNPKPYQAKSPTT